MPRTLLCNNALNNFAGSELVTLELAQELVGRGHEVAVATFTSSVAIRTKFECLGVSWLDLSKPVKCVQHFDLLWGHHFTCFDAILLDRGITATRVVYSSLSPFEPLECPPLYADSFTSVLANSPETLERLQSYGISSEQLCLMPNCVTQAWLTHKSRRATRSLKAVAVVSNHVPDELAASTERLKEAGIQVRIFGVFHEHLRVTPELLAEFDAVITIGRTVLSGLALSIPVFCYDRFGGPGYVTRENFERTAHFNFSGRCGHRKLSSEAIVAELIDRFPAAEEEACALSTIVRSRYSASEWIGRILDKIAERPPMDARQTGRIAQAARLRGVSTPVKSDDSVRRWLGARNFDAAALELATQKLRTADGAPSITCVIVDSVADSSAVGRTLKSFEGQRLPILIERHVVSCGTRKNINSGHCAHLSATLHTAPSQDVVETINEIAARVNSDWIIVLYAGEEIIPSGLMTAAIQLLESDGLRAVYADEMMRGADGELSALLRPDFNLDLLLSMPSGLARHWLVRRDVFLEAGGFDPAFADSPEFDLLLRLIDAGGIDGLGHVHEPLLILPQQEIRTRQSETEALLRHLRDRGYDQAAVEAHHPGCYRIRYGHAATPGVSIIIPTKNQLGMLRRCVESLLEKTAYQNYEVLIVDNGSTDADACTWLDGIEAMGSQQLQVIRYPQPFNYSAMNNLAARHARGEYLVLLNNDTAVLREDWLDAMLNHAQRPEVGVVGAKLLYPDGRIQHAGVVLGLRGPAEHPFIGDPHDAPGYMHRLRVDQNYSAVTGACLMIRKSLYEAVGGLDEEAFKVSYNDVDLCLKARAAGHLVVWTPHAVLLHEGSVSQARVDTSALEAKAKRFVGEQDAFYDRWLPAVANDPAYNRNLTLNGPAFQVETDPTFTWNPLSWRPLPVALALPADRFGCGHYRVIQPAAAMNGFGVADVRVGARYSSPVEIERLSPDVVVLQRQMLKGQLEPQKRMLRWSRAFKVAELDDYLPNMPMKSAHRGQLPNDVLKTMRDALKLVDRFVVSTAPLAEALAGLHPDIRVVENRLPLPWWGAVTAQRRRGQRPRVGWGGGAGHRGDLELIADVVRELADEVEWVFLGMCPDKLRPYVHEFHPGVAIEDYPARLAGLDLDLALAPLEDNLFNRCKSNLRLLEYGACGFPVVCSDVAPYRGALPVTRVKPRFRDWVEAIRMHTHDLDAAARAGDALRDAVHRDWMLDEASAAHWLSQWLPE